MKRFIFLLLLVLFQWSAAQTLRTYYQCPMDLEVVSSRPGSCPKCGMDLRKKVVVTKPKTVSKAVTTATKIQKPEPKPVQKPSPKPIQKTTAIKNLPVKSTSKNKAKSDFNKKESTKNNPVVKVKSTSKKPEISAENLTPKVGDEHKHSDSAELWVCPMHPEVKSEKPGKCPICGMFLEKITIEKKKSNEASINPKNFSNGKVNFEGRTVRYDLFVKDTIVNFTGKNRRAIATNGRLNAPTLYFKEGDTAEIYLHNQLKENTGLHWHGIILPNEMDGVPYLTTKPVKPGETHLYKFKVAQNGTYWYHSHEAVQEQIGMNGILVFGKRDDANRYADDIPVLLGDWSDEKPQQIARRLHMANTDWYAIKKNAVQSYSEAISSGNFITKLTNEWKRMEAMDVSDVYYNKFLVNGKVTADYSHLKAGDKVRLRVVNGASSTYFWINFGGGKFKVIANDGNEVQPKETDRLIVGVSETYDIEVTIPESKRYEVRATSEDRTGYTSVWLGSGEEVSAPNLPRLMLFEGMKMMNGMMEMSGNMKPMNMTMSNRQMDMNSVMYPELLAEERRMMMKHMDDMMAPPTKKMQNSVEMLADHDVHQIFTCPMHPEVQSDKPGDCPKCGMKLIPKNDAKGTHQSLQTLKYSQLKAAEITELPAENVRELHFNLEGNMNHYLWTMDNKTVTETDKIFIKKGEVLRITMYNNSMMRHPMHLHGHDFRLVNAAGEYSPSKNVVDIMPMETNTIEFAANQDGDWFFHCHILYHMMAGMGRVFSYQNSASNPELPDKKLAWKEFLKDNFMVSSMAMADVYSSGIHAETMTMFGPRWANINTFHSNWKFSHYNADVKIGRYLGKFQWAFPYVGFRAVQSHDYAHMAEMHEMGMAHDHDTTLFGQNLLAKKRNTFTVGMRYLLPMLISADASIDFNGKFILELSREDVPISPRIRGSFSVNSDREYSAGAKYILQKWLSVGGGYSSEMGWGAGVSLNY